MGLYRQEYSQQAKGTDYSPPLDTLDATSGKVCPVLDSPSTRDVRILEQVQWMLRELEHVVEKKAKGTRLGQLGEKKAIKESRRSQTICRGIQQKV